MMIMMIVSVKGGVIDVRIGGCGCGVTLSVDGAFRRRGRRRRRMMWVLEFDGTQRRFRRRGGRVMGDGVTG